MTRGLTEGPESAPLRNRPLPQACLPRRTLISTATTAAGKLGGRAHVDPRRLPRRSAGLSARTDSNGESVTHAPHAPWAAPNGPHDVCALSTDGLSRGPAYPPRPRSRAREPHLQEQVILEHPLHGHHQQVLQLELPVLDLQCAFLGVKERQVDGQCPCPGTLGSDTPTPKQGGGPRAGTGAPASGPSLASSRDPLEPRCGDTAAT